MERIKITVVLILWVPMRMWFIPRLQVEGIVDKECYDNCNCCKNNSCHSQYGWPNVCTEGCIDRHRGARCYGLCTYHCVSCEKDDNVCSRCFEGYFPGPNKDCTSECPTNCKACTSDTNCTACKDGYYDKDWSTTCMYSICPENCECIGSTCATCKNGFYDTDNECNKECPPGFHGLDCSETCSIQCLNRTCGIGNGVCDYGCVDEYSGDKCCLRNGNCIKCASNTECKECKPGYFSYTCKETCPVNCIESCDIISGACSVCKINRFGPLCNFTCSESCKVPPNSKTRRCASFDGTCIFGCEDGFFGTTCNKTCNRLCIDNVCMRESGLCVNGCTDSYDEVECALRKPKVASDSSTLTNIVLAALLALATAALCILIVWTIVKKIRSTNRQTEESLFQVPLEQSSVVNQTQQNEHAKDKSAYEILDRNQGDTKHNYDTASPSSTESTTNTGHTEYVNLQCLN